MQVDQFPVGATAGRGSYILSERLRGDRTRGQYRGINSLSLVQHPILVTVTLAHDRVLDQLARELEMPIEGVARLVHVGRLDEKSPGGAVLDAMVEEEPLGVPLSSLQLPLAQPAARDVLRRLVDVCRRAHAAGLALDCVQPELIYVETGATSMSFQGIAPRAMRFAAGARRSSQVPPPLFATSYDAPERLMGAPATAPADVFALCALAVHLLTGEHPFDGASGARQREAILAGRRRPLDRAIPWGTALERGLAAKPADRLDLAALAGELEAS